MSVVVQIGNAKLKSTRSYERDHQDAADAAGTDCLNPPALTSGILEQRFGILLVQLKSTRSYERDLFSAWHVTEDD